jgi:hypothetical protein
MRRLAWIGLLAYFLLAEGLAGIFLRDSGADYPAHETAGGVTVAGLVVPSDQVHKIFATDLNCSGHIVVEVAVYPEAGTGGRFVFSRLPPADRFGKSSARRWKCDRGYSRKA